SRAMLPDGGAAALVGGTLLNQNLEFIDTINDLVYRAASLPEGSQGTATLFLDDVRISTNVRLFEGRRALGTRVSAAVRSAVLGEGRTWLDSAFVVNDWYISAYEPLVDSYGKRVGMLYVGFLEKPFSEAKYQTLVIIVAAFIAITAATV
ncbi:two-component sensor histidine kinase, partial [Herbaspirillum sp. HC18]